MKTFSTFITEATDGVTLDFSPWSAEHPGKMPKGQGTWYFATVDPKNKNYNSDRDLISFGGKFTDALKKARKILSTQIKTKTNSKTLWIMG